MTNFILFFTFHAPVREQLAAVDAAEADPALNGKLSSVRWLGVRSAGGAPPRKAAGAVVTDQERVDEACTETVDWECRRHGNMSWIPELGARGV